MTTVNEMDADIESQSRIDALETQIANLTLRAETGADHAKLCELYERLEAAHALATMITL